MEGLKLICRGFHIIFLYLIIAPLMAFSPDIKIEISMRATEFIQDTKHWQFHNRRKRNKKDAP